MGSNQVPPVPSQPPGQPPTVTPPSTPSDSESHYTSLLAYFKHLVWLTGGAVTVVVAVVVFLFVSNLRDVRQDAKEQATRVATAEAEKGVRTAFDEKNVNELILKVAREKVAAITDQMIAEKVTPVVDKTIEQQLGSKLQAIQQQIVLVGRISECETRMRLGFRDGYDELAGILASTHDPAILHFGKSTLETTGKHFDAVFEAEIQRHGGTPLAFLATKVRPGTTSPSNLHDVVQIIANERDLNTVAVAFIAFRDVTRGNVKTFDFGGVKAWCANNKPKCE